MIRVGEDFYMVASSMHCQPGLPLLHSKDLVNWDFVTYVFDELDLGPDFHLEGKKVSMVMASGLPASVTTTGSSTSLSM